VNKTKFHEQFKHILLMKIYQTDHIPAIDSVHTAACWRPPGTLRP